MPLVADDYRTEKIQLYLDTYPDANKTEIARLLISKEKWETTPDVLRKLVAKIKGGVVIKGKKKDFSTPLDDMNFDSGFEIDLPKSFYEPRNRVVLSKAEDNILILNDIHIPYHNLNALKVAIKYGVDNHINTIILNGDIMDMYSISRFMKVPNKPRMQDEIFYTRQFFKVLREKFKDAFIYWKFGNHEERFANIIYRQLPEMADVFDKSLEEAVLVNEFGIKIVKDKKVIEAGKNNILHGHEVYSTSGAVNIARSIRTKANDNVTVGHWHIHQEDTAKTIGDKLIGAWVIPCLCGLSPDFNPYNNWSNGFAHQQTDSDGKFVMMNKKIINGLIK
jgi:predicted phosphodiesterase